MREIKFRAWDKINKIMIYPPDSFQSYHYFMTWTGLVYENGILKEYELLQYTGLKDKNNKEIYEGDIVEIKVGQFSFNREVRQSESGAWVVSLPVYNSSVEIDFFLYQFDYKKIIGNIFENPELLRG